MGTMSRYQCRMFGVSPHRLVRATQANRNLEGQRLLDVLTVIRHREQFNRACRRMVFSYWRKHCRRNRVDVNKGLLRFSGLVGQNDHPSLVQLRLLSHAL